MMNNTQSIQIVAFEKLDKGKRRLRFENGVSCIVYLSEIRGIDLKEDGCISNEVYTRLIKEIVGKRAKKRALHLLERMDRTEQQLREKLSTSEYPE